MSYGPAFLHLYGVDEADVLASWTVEKFERYRHAADLFLMRGGDRGN